MPNRAEGASCDAPTKGSGAGAADETVGFDDTIARYSEDPAVRKVEEMDEDELDSVTADSRALVAVHAAA